METRKVQEVSGGTFTVSLPREWTEAAGLTAGAVVRLYEHGDGSLVVRAREHEDAPGPGRVVERIDDGDPAHLERLLRATYAAGCEEVTLRSDGGFTGEQRRTVNRVTGNLTGTTVAGESETGLTVRTLLDRTQVSVVRSLRQLTFTALSMHREAAAALTGDAAPVDQGARDDQADRLFALIDRQFVRGLARLDEVDALEPSRPELFELWGTAHEVERVADHAERIAAIAVALDEPVSGPPVGDLATIARTVRGIVDDAVRVVVGDASIDTARRTLAARDRVRGVAADLDRRLFEAAGADYRLARVLDSLQRTAEHGGNVAELGLRAAIRRGELAADGTAAAGDATAVSPESRPATDREEG
jgi:phosphate uptake regulator